MAVRTEHKAVSLWERDMVQQRLEQAGGEGWYISGVNDSWIFLTRTTHVADPEELTENEQLRGLIGMLRASIADEESREALHWPTVVERIDALLGEEG